jgi:hypothetical protein
LLVAAPFLEEVLEARRIALLIRLVGCLFMAATVERVVVQLLALTAFNPAAAAVAETTL